MDASSQVLFECDQCGNREWRPGDQEPWLCAVCGYMRWSIVAESEADEGSDEGNLDDTRE